MTNAAENAPARRASLSNGSIGHMMPKCRPPISVDWQSWSKRARVRDYQHGLGSSCVQIANECQVWAHSGLSDCASRDAPNQWRSIQRKTLCPLTPRFSNLRPRDLSIASWARSRSTRLLPDAARAVLSDVQKSAKVPLLDVASQDRILNVGPDGRTKIRVVQPAEAEGILPVVVYVHGGGWVIGDKETHDRLIRELAVGANAVIVFVDYERSPESRYPTAIEQSYAVAKYVAEHPAEFGADPNRLVIAGDSVGGNMAAVVALMAKERSGPKIVAQLLFYPVTDASMSTGSYTEFADGPWLTKKAMSWFWDQYLPDVSKRGDIHASPLNASLEQLSGLPQNASVRR